MLATMSITLIKVNRTLSDLLWEGYWGDKRRETTGILAREQQELGEEMKRSDTLRTLLKKGQGCSWYFSDVTKSGFDSC